MRTRFVVVTLILVLLSLQLYALQDRVQKRYVVTVQGIVTDIQGDPLPGAEVALINISPLPVLTDANGFYRIQRGLTGSGVIALEISKPGYKTMVKPNILANIEDNLNFVVDCTLIQIP